MQFPHFHFGNKEEAKESIETALKLATCDGPPYHYKVGVRGIGEDVEEGEVTQPPPGLPQIRHSRFINPTRC